MYRLTIWINGKASIPEDFDSQAEALNQSERYLDNWATRKPDNGGIVVQHTIERITTELIYRSNEVS